MQADEKLTALVVLEAAIRARRAMPYSIISQRLTTQSHECFGVPSLVDEWVNVDRVIDRKRAKNCNSLRTKPVQALSGSLKSPSNSSSRPTKQKPRLFPSRIDRVYILELLRRAPPFSVAQSEIPANSSLACTVLYFWTFSLAGAVVALIKYARCGWFHVRSVDTFAEPVNLTVIKRFMSPSIGRDRVCVPCRGITEPSPQRGQNRSTFSLGEID